MNKQNWMSFYPIIIVLVIIASATGWFVDGFYDGNGALMAVKFRVYDLVLMTTMVPLGIVMFVLARTGRLWAKTFLLGTLIYLTFSYGINVFNCYQNQLFLIYIAILGLCLFSTIVGFIAIAERLENPPRIKLVKFISTVLLFNAVSGYGFWLSDAIGALIRGGGSMSIFGTDLPTNAAQVLDMGFMLPLTIVGAIKVWKYRSNGVLISAMMLVFFLLIGISVLSMEFGLLFSGFKLDSGKVYGFGVVTALSIIMAVFTYRGYSRLTNLKR